MDSHLDFGFWIFQNIIWIPLLLAYCIKQMDREQDCCHIWILDFGYSRMQYGFPFGFWILDIPEYNMDPPFAGLLHQANGSRARLLPTYSTQPNTMVIYDGYLTSSSSLSVPYLGVKTSMNSHSIFFDAIISWDIPLFDLMSLTKRILWEYFSQLTRWTT